jgi:hypothetical protein
MRPESLARITGGVLAGWALAGSLALAQQPCLPPPCAPAPWPAPPGQVTRPAPSLPAMPGAPTEPPAAGGNAAAPSPAAETAAPDFGGLSSGAGVGTAVALASPGGYVDDAIPQTLFRLRNDYETGINRFDRATFLFDTWREGSFHKHAFVNDGSIHGLFQDPKARGTQINNPDFRMDILSAYLEVAPTPRLSFFAELPYRFVHLGTNVEDANPPETSQEIKQFPETAGGGEVRNAKTDTSGVSDTIAGFKFAFVEDPGNRYFTFQFRTYFPTGDPGLGLGTNHYTLEPGVLLYQRLSERLVVQGEFMDWIPISAGNGAGSVLTYGAGFGYDVVQRPGLRVTPVVEVVGWTVLGGTEAVLGKTPGPVVKSPSGAPAVLVDGVFVPADHFFQSASGDTIVNLKLGLRVYCGDHSDFYAGWGQALTGSRWYEDIARVEYRYKF